MDNRIGIISEVVVLIFNLLIYMKLTVLKNDNLLNRMIMYIGSMIMLGVFFVFTYTGFMPEVSASFLCVTLPSFTLFFVLSKYKDFRFFVTFCFLDTVTLIIAFFSRAINIVGGNAAGIVSGVAVCILMLVIYVKGRPYFRRYRELMANVNDGWAVMALSTSFIYILLVLSAGYPKPLIQRIEYLPVYAFLSVTILSFYAVFIITLLQKRKLSQLNEQLINEKNWHQIAYDDALTGLKNRMAYMQCINDLERAEEKPGAIHAVMADIDNFKQINDTLGHHIGDLTLKNAAELFETAFSEENYSTFRIGGDEFAVIAIDVSPEDVERKIDFIKNSGFGADMGCSLSLGYSTVNFNQKNAMENAFIRADRAMYEEKLKNKSRIQI